MTIPDVCAIHHVSERTVRRWISEGRLRTSLRGGVVHVDHLRAERLAAEWRATKGKRRARPPVLARLT